MCQTNGSPSGGLCALPARPVRLPELRPVRLGFPAAAMVYSLAWAMGREVEQSGEGGLRVNQPCSRKPAAASPKKRNVKLEFLRKID